LQKDYFLEMRGPGPIGDALRYVEDGPFIDLYDLCRRSAECDALSDVVRAAAREVLKQVDRFVIASFGMSGYAGFEPGKNGIFIVLPADAPGCWRRFTRYTPPPTRTVAGRPLVLPADGARRNGKVENWFSLDAGSMPPTTRARTVAAAPQ
jgi:hypothetical protein